MSEGSLTQRLRQSVLLLCVIMLPSTSCDSAGRRAGSELGEVDLFGRWNRSFAFAFADSLITSLLDSVLVRPIAMATHGHTVIVFDQFYGRLFWGDSNGNPAGGTSRSSERFDGVQHLSLISDSAAVIIAPRQCELGIVSLSTGQSRLLDDCDSLRESVGWVVTGANVVILRRRPTLSTMAIGLVDFDKQGSSLLVPQIDSTSGWLMNEVFISGVPEESILVFAYRTHPWWGVLHRDSVSTFPTVDSGPQLATIETESRQSRLITSVRHAGHYTRAVATTGDVVHLMQDDGRFSIVDVFSLGEGEYLFSYRIPFRATSISVSGGGVYTLASEPPFVRHLVPECIQIVADCDRWSVSFDVFGDHGLPESF